MKKKKRYNGKRKKFHSFRFITILLAILVGFELVAGGVGLIGLQSFLSDKQELKIEDFALQESTLVFDANGTQLADVGTQLRENIEYTDIPEALMDAFLSIEDSRFWTHNGFDIPRFVKSVFNTFLKGDMQGGSTFTMQLVKLTYFQDDDASTAKTKDIKYKLHQIALAMDLEKIVNKQKIFELYVNKMNFGGIGNIRGIQKASQQFFGKNTNELSISECALMAGIVNAPYYYDPHFFLEHARTRRNEVLNLMKTHGYITEAEWKLAKTVNVEDLLVDPALSNKNTEGYAYQAYIDEALKEAEQLTGQDPMTVSMEIYTAMNPEVQAAMENIAAGNDSHVKFSNELMEVGIISEDNHTGEIVGICGGRNYSAGGSMLLNHATANYQQPGSSVKPFLDYALAFEYCGWATSHVITDKPVANGNWVYKNASGKYNGQVTLEYALGHSLNTTAIQALREVIDTVGEDKVKEYLASLGFRTSVVNQFDISYAIGGNAFACSPKELMAAHAIMMNGGNYIKPHTVRKIVFRSGLQEPLEPVYVPVQVLSEQAAYLTSYMMNRNINGGYAYYGVLKRSYPTYAKTGTSDWGEAGLQYGIPKGARKDKWMVAETSKYTTAVWVGFDKAVKGKTTYFTTSMSNANIPGKINSVMIDVLNKADKPKGIEKPNGISEISHILATWPYAKPISGMSSQYIAKGMIKSEYKNSLVSPQSRKALSSLGAFSAAYNSNDSITFNWRKYPDASALKVASSTMDISLTNAKGKKIVSATGKRLFDYSWVWGAVCYKARVSQNGRAIAEISASTDTHTQIISGLAPNTETKVCGYYGYTVASNTSNEICTSFTTPRRYVNAPSAGATVDQIRKWANTYGINLSISYADETAGHPAGSVQLLQGGKSILGGQADTSLGAQLIVYEHVHTNPVQTPKPQNKP
ncbi:MAG: transglycosylase domain-containing protein [Solobacterium sp.]|nr:transglycosylase domain-containing protein [Solobacterium sp.]